MIMERLKQQKYITMGLADYRLLCFIVWIFGFNYISIAQVPGYSVSFSDVSKNTSPVSEAEFSGTITHLSSSSEEYTMEYTVISMPTDWSFYFCDPVYCHASSTTSSTFTLSEIGGKAIKGFFNVNSEGSGEVELSFTKNSTGTDTVITLTVNPNNVSLETYESFKPLKVYPNPTSNHWNVVSDVFIKSWKLYDFSGRIIHSDTQIESKLFVINSAKIETGTYILELTNALNKQQVVSVIKM